jgi:hypothetical protein
MGLKRVRNFIYFLLLVRSGRCMTCTREQLNLANR